MLLETNHGQWETKEVRESNGSIRDRDMGNLFGTARQGKARQGKARQENRETPPFFLLGWMTSIPEHGRHCCSLSLSLFASVCHVMPFHSDRIASIPNHRDDQMMAGSLIERQGSATERNGTERNGTQRILHHITNRKGHSHSHSYYYIAHFFTAHQSDAVHQIIRPANKERVSPVKQRDHHQVR